MLDVGAALRLQAETAPRDRSRLTLSACAGQVDRAVMILEVALQQVESIDRKTARAAAYQMREALLRLRGSPQSEAKPSAGSLPPYEPSPQPTTAIGEGE